MSNFPSDEPPLEAPERVAAPLEAEVLHQSGEDGAARRDKFAVLRVPDFRRYLIGGALAAAGAQMTGLAAGWELYSRTRQPFSLALLGLMSALPVIFLALPAGTLADRRSRKKIALGAEAGAMVMLALLALVSYLRAPLALFYLVILGNAICGAFLGPALGALATNVVPPHLIPEATKWSSIRWQLASTIGPVVGGFLVARLGAEWPIYCVRLAGPRRVLLFPAAHSPARSGTFDRKAGLGKRGRRMAFRA